MFKRSCFALFLAFSSVPVYAGENVILTCAKKNIPEALISGGIYAAVLNPAALAVALAYYGNSLYKCKTSSEEFSDYKKSLEDKEAAFASKIESFEKSINDYDSKFKNSNERIARTEEDLKKSVDESLTKVKDDYVNLNKSLVEYAEKIKEKQKEFTQAVDGKIEEMNKSKEVFIKEIEEKSGFEKENIMTTGDEAIKNIYQQLKKIEESEVKIEKKVYENGVSEETSTVKKPLENIEQNTKEGALNKNTEEAGSVKSEGKK